MASNSFDVEKAFLQGVTYEELHELTGEPPRKVYFVLLAGFAAMMRKLKGFEAQDERYHVGQALIPATGTADAPRAFTLKLTKLSVSNGYAPTKGDPELLIKHAGGNWLQQ